MIQLTHWLIYQVLYMLTDSLLVSQFIVLVLSWCFPANNANVNHGHVCHRHVLNLVPQLDSLKTFFSLLTSFFYDFLMISILVLHTYITQLTPHRRHRTFQWPIKSSIIYAYLYYHGVFQQTIQMSTMVTFVIVMFLTLTPCPSAGFLKTFSRWWRHFSIIF